MLQSCPAGVTTAVKSVEVHHRALPEAQPGDNAGFTVRNVSFKQQKREFVCSASSNDRAKDATDFTAQVSLQGTARALHCACLSPVMRCSRSGPHVHAVHTLLCVLATTERLLAPCSPVQWLVQHLVLAWWQAMSRHTMLCSPASSTPMKVSSA